ncbi:MAG TPA: zinc ribbon domain-containing protein [Candidatus Polarisedimenticolia bacterium]|nr:zinc ribbon domain-containing protein [Candidatus Polarisedimenticolia bacterium]
MPIYEYRCSACRKKSSALLASYSSPDPVCPHCGKLELKRLVSTFATARSSDDGGDDFGGDDDFGGGGGDDGGDFGGDDDF